MGIAVLPEDAAKAGLWKKHPHQQEVIFVLQGALRLIIDDRPEDVVGEGELRVIEKGQCHRIVPAEDEHGVYLFCKTNPAKEIMAENCA